MRKSVHVCLGLFILLLFGYASVKTEDVYENIEITKINLNENFVYYYVFHQETSNFAGQRVLFIYLSGSGMESVLGIQKDGRWVYRSRFLTSLIAYCSTKADLMIPEKMNVTYGNNHIQDEKVYMHYTLEDLVRTASTVVDYFLNHSGNGYDEVVLIGASEGACILPRVYQCLGEKKKITRIILLSGGGLTQLEEFQILSDSDLAMPDEYRDILSQAEEVARYIETNNDLEKKWYAGYPLIRWKGFFSYRPLDDLIQINIPILMINGNKDISLPIESARTVIDEFKRLNKNNLTYLEYRNADHALNYEYDRLFKDIDSWLNNSN